MITVRKMAEKDQIALTAREKLIALAKQGDPEAQAKLMKRHGIRVYTPEEIRAFEKL